MSSFLCYNAGLCPNSYDDKAIAISTLSPTLSLPSLLMKWRFEHRINKQMEAIKKVGIIWNNAFAVGWGGVRWACMCVCSSTSWVGYGCESNPWTFWEWLFWYNIHCCVHCILTVQGFNDVFPLRMLQIFDERELEVRLCMHTHMSVIISCNWLGPGTGALNSTRQT